MQIEELFNLTIWVRDKITNAELSELYNALQGKLHRNASPQQQKAGFESERDSLKDALGRVPIEQLSQSQLSVLKKIGIGSYVGQEGVKNLEDILYDNTLDIKNAADTVKQNLQSLNDGIKWAKETRERLREIINESDVRPIESDEILIRIRFDKDSSISNIVDLKHWSDAWYDIVRGIALLHDNSPEDVRIIGASKGSFLLDIVSYLAFAQVASLILGAIPIKLADVLEQ